MTGPVVHHVAVLLCSVGAWRLLSAGRWTWLAPRLGVVWPETAAVRPTM